MLRSSGYDGVLYKSALQAKGINVALFEPSSGRTLRFATYKVGAFSMTLTNRTGYSSTESMSSPAPSASTDSDPTPA